MPVVLGLTMLNAGCADAGTAEIAEIDRASRKRRERGVFIGGDAFVLPFSVLSAAER
jgi:hypothetical protein